jgi:hypothetical protein
MALWSTQSLTEMSTRNHPGSKKRPARRADNLATIYEPDVSKCEPQSLTTRRTSTVCTGIQLPFLCYKPEGSSFDSRWGFYIFNLRNHSSRTMSLESTQTLEQMNTRNIRGDEQRPARKAENITACLENVESSMSHNLWVSTAGYRDNFMFYFSMSVHTVRHENGGTYFKKLCYWEVY